MKRFHILAVAAALACACTSAEPAPEIILGGELANSSASSPEYLRSRGSFKALREAGLNTVLCPVYWELIEPEEGRFDFSTVDALLKDARKSGLHLVLLWFGTWKNSMSCYVPAWVKQGFGSRFTLAQLPDGSTQEIISAFDGEALAADCRAFSALMEHLSRVDSRKGTVLMVQVENEIGFLGAAREYGQAAQAAWEAEGHTGADPYEEECFQARHYARYAGAVAAAGKASYDIPMFVNAALDSRGRKPGEYPSAGPLAQLMDIWKTEAPAIDMMCPDIYDPGFPDWIARYDRPGNRLFIPEIRQSPENGARVFYALGRHGALGFSPFNIDADMEPTAEAYRLLGGFTSLIARKQAEGKACGVLLDRDHPEETVTIAGTDILCRHDGTLSWSPVYGRPEDWGEAALLILDLDEDGLLFLGTGATTTENGAAPASSGAAPAGSGAAPANNRGHCGILSIDEVTDGSLKPLRRLNGDENHQGRHLRIPHGSYGAQLLKLYRYD